MASVAPTFRHWGFPQAFPGHFEQILFTGSTTAKQVILERDMELISVAFKKWCRIFSSKHEGIPK